MTPWGATLAAQEQRAAALNADRDKRIRVAKAESTARTGMILALVGLPICCGPVSLVGGAIGWRGARLAKAEGLPRPTTAVVAMVVAVVSTLGFCAGVTMFIRDQQKKSAHTAEVQSRLQGKRDAVTLEPTVACDLVEEYLVQNGYGEHTLGLDAVHCDGALTTTERRAQIADVRFAFGTNHSTVTACLERRSRWFVLELKGSGTCADLPPIAPFTAPARQFSDEEALADEKKTREDLSKAAGTAALTAFTTKLTRVRESAAATAGAEKVCTTADLASFVKKGSRLEVPAVDLDFLGGSRAAEGPKGWPMLTSASLRLIFDEKRKPEERAKGVSELREGSGPLLVVYRPEKKLWPVVHTKSGLIGKDFSYEGGEYDGWLMVYDIDSTARLCQTKLTFESSDAVNFKKSRFSSEKAKAKEAIEGDFKEQFETAATSAIKRAAPDLRLGYQVLE